MSGMYGAADDAKSTATIQEAQWAGCGARPRARRVGGSRASGSRAPGMTPFRTPYVDYDVLAKWDTPSWDDQTREVLRKRLTEVPARRFFSGTEWQTLEAVCGRLVPQPERSDPIPIVPWIDEKLHHNWRDGFRYDDMPPCARRGVLASRESITRVAAGSARTSGRSLKRTKTRCSGPSRPAM